MRLIFIGEVFLTEVPEEDFRSGVALENMSHEPLAFLSGSFKGSQCVGQLWTRKVSQSLTLFVGWNIEFRFPRASRGLHSRSYG